MTTAVQSSLFESTEDYRLAIEAILDDADAHDGWINPNRVREAVSDDTGIRINPRVIGKAYRDLARAGAIYRLNGPEWWVISTDKRGGNAGKQARVWRRAGA